MPEVPPTKVELRIAALDKVARCATRLVETIRWGEQTTKRSYAHDLDELRKALAAVDALDPA